MSGSDTGAGLRYELDLSGGLSGKYAEVARRIPPASRVLELGGASGYFARELVRAGHTVTLVDYDPANVAKARATGLEAHLADLSQPLPEALFENGAFDVVLMMDVAEHLADPARLLAELRLRLGPQSRLIVTGPNVAYWWVRLHLLRGRWDYSDTGVMDHTHLRWFTRKTWIGLLEGAGYRVEVAEAAEGLVPKQHWLRYVGVSPVGIERFRAAMLRRFPQLLASVLLFVARPRQS